jgi:hypothetical protein
MKSVKRLSVSERQNQRMRNLIGLIVIIGIIGSLSIIIKSYFTDAISVSGVSVENSETGVLVKYTLKNQTNKSHVVTLDIILYSRNLSLWPKVPESVSGQKRIKLLMHPKEKRYTETVVPAIWPVVRSSVFVVSCKEKGR